MRGRLVRTSGYFMICRLAPGSGVPPGLPNQISEQTHYRWIVILVGRFRNMD